MRNFKLPLIATGIAFLLAIIAGLIIITSIHGSQDSRTQKEQRAQTAGAAVAGATCLIVAPFWLYAAAKVGKQRRQARDHATRARNQLRR